MLRVGIRDSRLSQIQAKLLLNYLDIEYELFLYKTKGDIDKKTPLELVENSDFFTDILDEALIKKQIDIAIHSAKDLPQNLPEGLKVIFKTESPDKSDALVSRQYKDIFELEAGAIIGTSSRRRREQLKAIRPDLLTKSLRGTIEERLVQLDKGDYDAIIVATIALKRLGLAHRITQVLPLDLFDPHPEQGRLAVVAREDRTDLIKLFSQFKGLAI